jgi:putative ABC transport system substrate-binding protein
MLALMGVALASTHFVDAQPTAKVYRVGFLSIGSAGPQASLKEALRDGLRERGWVEGKNIAVDYRFAENRADRLPELAAELVRLKVDVIVAMSGGVLAAKKVTGTIPIVMASGIADPVGLGLVTDLARPGGNVTGIAAFGLDVNSKRLQLLKEAVPNARRFAILSNPAAPTQAASVSNVRAAAQSLGVSLQLLEARTPADFDAAFAAMAKERADALYVVADPLFGTHAARVVDLAIKNRLPTIHGAKGEFDPGGLIFYGASVPHQVGQAAGYVDKILKGAKPADLPVEQPSKYDLAVNLRTAKALGLTIPQSLLMRANAVIE